MKVNNLDGMVINAKGIKKILGESYWLHERRLRATISHANLGQHSANLIFKNVNYDLKMIWGYMEEKSPPHAPVCTKNMKIMTRKMAWGYIEEKSLSHTLHIAKYGGAERKKFYIPHMLIKKSQKHRKYAKNHIHNISNRVWEL